MKYPMTDTPGDHQRIRDVSEPTMPLSNNLHNTKNTEV